MLYGWMKSIIIYLIVSGILVNLSPGNNYKKYIHFFSGLLLIIILAEPITGLINDEYINLSEIVENIDKGVDVYGYGEEGHTDNYYEISMDDSIYRYLKGEGLEAAGVDVITNSDYEILKCTVNYRISDGNNSELTDEDLEIIKNKISDVYNVDRDNIYIVSR